MGWFLVIIGTFGLFVSTQVKIKNATGGGMWAVVAIFAVWAIACVAVIALGAAVNQGWLN